MNFCNLLVIVYILAEFVDNSKSLIQDVQIAGESRKKRKAVKRANEKGVELLSYRYSIEEPARIRANKHLANFQRHTHAAFTNVKPQGGIYTGWLWNRAKEATDKYKKIKSKFEHEKFCYPPMSDNICSKVFENKFFKKEKLTYDASTPSLENGCVMVRNYASSEKISVAYDMEYKSCLAKKQNQDGTQTAVKVYLQSLYKQPLFGYKYLVSFMYFFNQRSGTWVRPTDPRNTDGGSMRYEALLSL